MPLVKWEDICKAKDFGGLGLRQSVLVNKASMMKVGWNLINKKDDLWVKVLRSKYGCGEDMVPRITHKTDASNLWRGICSYWSHVEKNLEWRIGNGSAIGIWFDHWALHEGPFIKYATNMPQEYDLDSTVNHFVSLSDQWDRQKLLTYLPDEVCKKILALHVPTHDGFADRIIWSISHDGDFSLYSAYNSLLDNLNHNPRHVFKLIWKWRGPQWVRTFLWLVAHEALLTNRNRVRRHIATSDLCPVCRVTMESIIHAVSDCHRISIVWSCMVKDVCIGDFFGWNLEDWLVGNFSQEIGRVNEQPWSLTFALAIDSFWFARNMYVFESQSFSPMDLVLRIQARAKEVCRALDTNDFGSKVTIGCNI